MAFDISTVTFKGAELFAAATAADKLIVSGCDAFTSPYTLAQAQAVTTRVSSPMTTSTDVTLVGSGNNHVMLRSIFEAGVTTGGDANTLMIFGHKESDPSNDYVLCVVSSTDAFHLPLTTDAITTFETLFDVEYVVPGDSVATATTAVFATLAEFNDLKSRAVLCHDYGDSTHGPDQNVYGSKRFMNIAYFYNSTSIRKKDRPGVTTTESAWATSSLSGFNNNLFEYRWSLWGDNGDYATVFVKSRGNDINSNDNYSGEFIFIGNKVSFECPINLSSSIVFEQNDNGIWPVISYDNTSSDGALRFINVNNGWRSNELIIADGDDGVPYIELSTSDIRFTKHSSCDIPDSNLKFSIGPFNTETFGDIKMYNRDADARRLHGRQRVNNSFDGRYIRYFMSLEDDNNHSVCDISLQHLDTWDEGHVFISGKTLHLDVDNIYPDSNRTVKVGSSDSMFDEAYVNHIYTHQLDVDEAMSVDELDVDSFLRLQTVYAKQGDVLTVNISDTDCGLEVTEPPDCIGAHIVYVQKNGTGSTARLDVKANDIYIGCQAGSLSGGFMVNSLDTTFQDSPVTFDNGSAVTFDADVTINGFVDSNITPKTSNSKDLGSSSKRWATIYTYGIECDDVTCDTVYGNLKGCVPYSGDGTTSVSLKAGTIGLFFISKDILGGDVSYPPGKSVSFSNSGRNKIYFAKNYNDGTSSSFVMDDSTLIIANTVHLVLLSTLHGRTNFTHNLALCMITADQ